MQHSWKLLIIIVVLPKLRLRNLNKQDSLCKIRPPTDTREASSTSVWDTALNLRDFNAFVGGNLGEFTSTLDIILDKESSWILASVVTCHSPLETCSNPVLKFQHVSRFQCWLLQAKLLMVHYRWTGHSKRSATKMWEYRWAGIFTWIVDISIGQKLNIQIRNPG